MYTEQLATRVSPCTVIVVRNWIHLLARR